MEFFSPRSRHHVALTSAMVGMILLGKICKLESSRSQWLCSWLVVAIALAMASFGCEVLVSCRCNKRTEVVRSSVNN